MEKNIKEIENRYECHIPEKRVKIWEVQLNLWKVFDSICKKYNLRYFFFYGSMLGAVRHKGFVPWDDDIDVVMPREDYDKFGNVALKEIKNPYFLLTKDTVDKSIYWFMKLVDESTTCILNQSLNPIVHHQGLSLDIVPLDGVPSQRSTRVRYFFCRELDYICMNNTVQKWNMLGWKGRLIKPLCNLYCIGKSREKIVARTEKIRARYKWNECEWVTEAAHRFKFKKKYFEDVIYMEFEGYQVPVPVGYKNLLKQIYGNYMELPPVNERVIPEDEAGGWIIEPDLSIKEYFDLSQKQKNIIKNERKKWFHRYCD